MRTNATVTALVVVHLDQQERFSYTRPVNPYDSRPHGDTYVVEEVGYHGGLTSFVGRKVLQQGNLAKRMTMLHNIPAREVPEDIAVAIRGAVRARVGEQAKALGLLR
jgi:hypothetical protein